MDVFAASLGVTVYAGCVGIIFFGLKIVIVLINLSAQTGVPRCLTRRRPFSTCSPDSEDIIHSIRSEPSQGLWDSNSTLVILPHAGETYGITKGHVTCLVDTLLSSRRCSEMSFSIRYLAQMSSLAQLALSSSLILVGRIVAS